MIRTIFSLAIFLFCYCAKASTIDIKDAWVRATIEDAGSTSFYFNIQNLSEKSDYLLEVKSDISDEIHMQKTVSINGISKSVMIDKIVLPANTEVKFAPFGINVLLANVKKQIKVGSKVKLTLLFKNSPSIEIHAFAK